MDLSDIDVMEEVLCFNSTSPPWFLNPIIFWILSALLFSWPLRLYAEWRTAILNYQITKLFGTNYLSPSSMNYTGPLTRTSTMETVELEAALRRDRYFIVPSYSEAMLLEPHGGAAVTVMNAVCEPRVFSRTIEMNNENLILPNYGALEDQVGSLPRFNRVRRPLSNSRSMNWERGDRDEAPSRSIPSLGRSGPPRSLSISGGGYWSNGYQLIDSSPDRTPMLHQPNEPPPPYEMALRMCAPIYERLRRSISSRLNSISHSSSKDLKPLTSNNNNNNGNPS